MYSPGDIIVVKFPFTDGSEFKKRPVLIVSNDAVNKTGDYLVVQITSKLHNDGLSIPISDQDCLQPLPLKSSIKSHKIFTIDTSLMLSKITSTTPDIFRIATHTIRGLMKS